MLFRSRTAVVPGAAHMVNMEQPHEFNGMVLEFLQEVGWIAPGEAGP